MLYLRIPSQSKTGLYILSLQSKVITSDAKIKARYISHNVTALVGTTISHLPV